MHDIQHRGFRYTLAASGMAASLIFLLASMMANYKYGSSLARSEMEGYAYGGAAAACDVLMAAAPFFFFAALRNRSYTQAFAAFLLWATMTAVAAVSALAQTSANRIDAISHRITTSNTYSDTRAELEEARAARKQLGVWTRNEHTVRAEVERHKAKHAREWSASSECTEITGKSQREMCANYQTLLADLGKAQTAAKLDARIETLAAKSDTMGQSHAPVTSEADPGAKTLSLISGYELRSVQSAMVGLIALMFLVGAGLGPYASWSVMEGLQSPRKLDAVTVVEPVISLNVGDTPKPELSKPLALPKPDSASPEWRTLLDDLGVPRKRPMGKLNPKEDQDRMGWRWYAWLVSHGHVGQIPADRMDALYDAYNRAIHCEPSAYRIAKNRLEQVRWVSKSANPVIWNIKAPTNGPDTLRKLLVNKKILAGDAPATPEPAPEETVVPFARRIVKAIGGRGEA